MSGLLLLLARVLFFGAVIGYVVLWAAAVIVSVFGKEEYYDPNDPGRSR